MNLIERQSLPTLVLLPGMDGTGDLYTSFVAAFGRGEGVEILGFPANEPAGYEALESWISQKLPISKQYVLLAESFSGPLAVRIAASKPDGLLGLVLCCTFVRNPQPALKFLTPMAGLLPVKSLPMWVLSGLLMGPYATPKLQSELAGALAQVSSQVMRCRLLEVAYVDVSSQLKRLSLPLLCISAADDRIISASAAQEISFLAPHARHVQLKGPHFLLQACPAQSATVIREFMADIYQRTTI